MNYFISVVIQWLMRGRIDYGKATFKAVENPMTKRFVNEESNRNFSFLHKQKVQT